MNETVQARLDNESQEALRKLMQRLGWSSSQVVREGIRLVAACYGADPEKKIVGLGQFTSGISDLGSNKKHLEGFGR